jgi:RHS repeat-associated protein
MFFTLFVLLTTISGVVGGVAYNAPAVYIRTGSGDWTLHYIHRDHLGSITAITNSSGSKVVEYSYDPWGRQRNPVNQQAYAPDAAPTLLLKRGYTGHEHLPMFDLVNMNARLYDPILGRFLSPDPYVQAPEFSQSFNRYSYCVNNPLRYTDPDGEWAIIDDLIAAVVGGVINLVTNAIQGNIHSFGQGFALFGVGAAGAWAGLYAGPLVSGTIIGAGNEFINQGFGSGKKWNWDNIDGGQILMGGLMGMGMSYVGGQVGGWIGPHVSKVTSHLGGQAIQQMALQGLSGAGTGFVIGTGVTLLGGKSLEEAINVGLQGAAFGFVTGSVSGLASGLRTAHKAHENPWTGKRLNKQCRQLNGFFEDAEYSPKVLRQMSNTEDVYHAFPENVDGYASKYGQLSTKTGGDGNIYHLLELPGSYRGKTGTFEYIKDANGLINHRFFRVR